MPKYRVKVNTGAITVWEVEADTQFTAEELAWEGKGVMIDSYSDWMLDEVLSSEEVD